MIAGSAYIASTFDNDTDGSVSTPRSLNQHRPFHFHHNQVREQGMELWTENYTEVTVVVIQAMARVLALVTIVSTRKVFHKQTLRL